MDLQKRFDYISYRSYKFKAKYDVRELFDLELLEYIVENPRMMKNGISDLLSYIDLSPLFENCDKGMNEIQANLIKMFAVFGMENTSQLLSNVNENEKFMVVSQYYREAKDKGIITSHIANFTRCLSDDSVVRFMNENNDLITNDEILYVIKELYSKGRDNALINLLKNERIANVAINGIKAPFFYEMVNELNLPNFFVEMRDSKLKHIIDNYDEYDIKEVKEAYCELYFRDELNNIMIDIETIVEMANNDEDFKNNYLKEDYNAWCKILEFLQNDSDYSQKDIRILSSDCPFDRDYLTKHYDACKSRFNKLVSDAITVDVTEGTVPGVAISSSGKEVKVYNIENESDMKMLISSIPVADTAETFKRVYYSDENGEVQKNRRCCSLIDEEHLNLIFGGTGRVVFGFTDIEGRVVTSASLSDGRTDGNESYYRRHRKVSQSTYTSLDKFIDETMGHNEITVNMGSAGKVMTPAYILVTSEPTQFEIDLAAEFDIPIRFVNKQKYEQKPKNPYKAGKDYEYSRFDRKKPLPDVGVIRRNNKVRK